MRAYDFSPLFRSTVGFDRVSRLLDAALEQTDGGTAYPPYNIATVGENQYRITMAVAGFTEGDIEPPLGGIGPFGSSGEILIQMNLARNALRNMRRQATIACL